MRKTIAVATLKIMLPQEGKWIQSTRKFSKPCTNKKMLDNTTNVYSSSNFPAGIFFKKFKVQNYSTNIFQFFAKVFIFHSPSWLLSSPWPYHPPLSPWMTSTIFPHQPETEISFISSSSFLFSPRWTLDTMQSVLKSLLKEVIYLFLKKSW